MEFHESGLLRFKQKADMGIVHPLHKSTVGGRKDQDLVLVGNNNPVRNTNTFTANTEPELKKKLTGVFYFMYVNPGRVPARHH